MLLYGGFSPNSTAVLDTSAKTLQNLTVLEQNRRYSIRVTAVYADGSESEFSNEERLVMQRVESDVNLVPDGDFSPGKDTWIFETQGTDDATRDVESGVCPFLQVHKR